MSCKTPGYIPPKFMPLTDEEIAESNRQSELRIQKELDELISSFKALIGHNIVGIRFNKKDNVPVLVLDNGTRLLARDSEYGDNALVIYLEGEDIELETEEL